MIQIKNTTAMLRVKEHTVVAVAFYPVKVFSFQRTAMVSMWTDYGSCIGMSAIFSAGWESSI